MIGNKTAFVTGGTGFVGSHLVEALLERGYSEVRCLIRSKPKWLKSLDIVPIYGKLGHTELIKRALHGVEYVYHLGALTRARTWEVFHAANVEGTMQLMAAATNVSRICVASSLAVVGKAQALMADESTPCQPVSRYGQSKLSMEKELAKMDLPLVVLRPPSVYGPRDRDLLTFFSAVNQGICPVPLGDPGMTLVYVKDLVRGIIKAAESPRTAGETYFVGDRQVTTWEALRQATESALGRKSWMIRIPRSLIMTLGATSELVGRLSNIYPAFNREKAREILHATKQCSSLKAQDHFGYVPRVSLEQGIQETIAWYRTQGWLR